MCSFFGAALTAAYFHINGNRASSAPALTEVSATSFSKDGVTIRVLQTIYDTVGVYVTYELTVPEHITLPANAAFVNDVLIPSFPLAHKDRLGGYGGRKILEMEPHRLVVLRYAVEKDLDPLNTTLLLGFLPNVSLYDEAGKEWVLLEEQMVLKWPLQFNDTVTSWTPGVPIKGRDCSLEKVVLSPISLVAYIDGDSPMLEGREVSLLFSDGSTRTMAAGNDAQSNHTLLTPESEGIQHRFYYRFHSLVDITMVKEVVIGDITLPCAEAQRK